LSEPLIQTYTGRFINPYDPNPDDICIEDIAHALSLINRFTGHTTEPYSVAEHSIWMSLHATNEARMAALLHDAAEAYLGDQARPIKTHEYRAAERYLLWKIFIRFGIKTTPKIEHQVKELDNWALYLECKRFMPVIPEGIKPYANYMDERKLEVRPWQEVEKAFLEEFEYLANY